MTLKCPLSSTLMVFVTSILIPRLIQLKPWLSRSMLKRIVTAPPIPWETLLVDAPVADFRCCQSWRGLYAGHEVELRGCERAQALLPRPWYSGLCQVRDFFCRLEVFFSTLKIINNCPMGALIFISPCGRKLGTFYQLMLHRLRSFVRLRPL